MGKLQPEPRPSGLRYQDEEFDGKIYRMATAMVPGTIHEVPVSVIPGKTEKRGDDYLGFWVKTSPHSPTGLRLTAFLEYHNPTTIRQIEQNVAPASGLDGIPLAYVFSQNDGGPERRVIGFSHKYGIQDSLSIPLRDPNPDSG
ncbi:hypothetical protein ACFLQN_00735 [Candidatus Aenigmatarchaeota archaeon]